MLTAKAIILCWTLSAAGFGCTATWARTIDGSLLTFEAKPDASTLKTLAELCAEAALGRDVDWGKYEGATCPR